MPEMGSPAVPKAEKSSMTPPELVAELDKFIIGQADAKRAMASAIRYRWRRQQLDESKREDCTPRNILMIGPTGCGILNLILPHGVRYSRGFTVNVALYM